ncbi:5'-methylthioadenosine/S-adenosylhomocysteine nucleosidase [Thalassospira sp.]|uniref:5'-methylthioadenosine/S-adenosylhomocysteine nucleosidase family protein n=1 Tax=Thalassospira sp. TaxID=1912094 RepID=UPI001B0DAE76|nr:5'-methylthioadenosine/S-adenosylhomocysteine nucleosidase [Thalassospira sp.]MBO6580595.1 5'-methylthioadenosine/S-adenosylhomocysteine nucleosidase [Thalassospira sp.]MBO6819042.1 5'-methylthioadenosine/S-adenosylhomocysteine nucleosidase [Thalassospira sp.]
MQCSEVRVLVLVAIDREHTELCSHIDNMRRKTTEDGSVYFIGNVNNKNNEQIEIAVYQTEAGQTKAGLSTTYIINDFNPHFAIYCGVAGGNSEKVSIGDVVVPSEMVYFERGKIKPGTFEARPHIYEPSHALKDAARAEKLEAKWLDLLPDGRPNSCRVHIEKIATGEKVITDSEALVWKDLMAAHPNIYAVEMEAHGFMRAMNDKHLPALMIRGISDLLDDKNAIIDGMNDDQRQVLAAQRAAAFTISLIKNLDTEWLSPKTTTDLPLTITVEGEEKDIKALHKELNAVVSKFIQNNELTLKHWEVGSIILNFDASPEACRILSALYNAGFLSELLGRHVIALRTSVEQSGNPEIDFIADLIEKTSTPDRLDRVTYSRQMINALHDIGLYEIKEILETIVSDKENSLNGDKYLLYGIDSPFPNPATGFDVVLYSGNGIQKSQTIKSLLFAADWVWVTNTNASGNVHFFSRFGEIPPSILGSANHKGSTDLQFRADGITLTGDLNIAGDTYCLYAFREGPNFGTKMSASTLETTNFLNSSSYIDHPKNSIWFFREEHGRSGWRLAYKDDEKKQIEVLNISSPRASLPLSRALNELPATPKTNIVSIRHDQTPGFFSSSTYIGNGHKDGPYINTDFTSHIVLIKRLDSAGDWYLWDTERDRFNPRTHPLLLNSPQPSELRARSEIDILSWGVKIRTTYPDLNAEGGKYLMLRWARVNAPNRNAE